MKKLMTVGVVAAGLAWFLPDQTTAAWQKAVAQIDGAVGVHRVEIAKAKRELERLEQDYKKIVREKHKNAILAEDLLAQKSAQAVELVELEQKRESAQSKLNAGTPYRAPSGREYDSADLRVVIAKLNRQIADGGQRVRNSDNRAESYSERRFRAESEQLRFEEKIKEMRVDIAEYEEELAILGGQREQVALERTISSHDFSRVDETVKRMKGRLANIKAEVRAQDELLGRVASQFETADLRDF